MPDSNYDEAPQRSVGHAEEHCCLHGQAEASNQMMVDDGDREEEPNQLSQHHGSV